MTEKKKVTKPESVLLNDDDLAGVVGGTGEENDIVALNARDAGVSGLRPKTVKVD